MEDLSEIFVSNLHYPTGHFEVLSNNAPFVMALNGHRSPTGTELVSQDLHLLRYDRRGSLVDTIPTLPYGTKKRIRGPDPNLVGSPIFEARSSFAGVGEHVFTTNGADPEIRVWDSDISLRRILRWQPPDRTVSSSDVDIYKRNSVARYRIESHKRRIRAANDDVPVEEEFPAVQELKVDRNGGLWVRRYPKPASTVNTWLSFDANGVFRCVLTVQRESVVLHIGDHHLLLKTTNDLGIERVELYDLESPSR